jgi:hypothetical protein
MKVKSNNKNILTECGSFTLEQENSILQVVPSRSSEGRDTYRICLVETRSNMKASWVILTKEFREFIKDGTFTII